MAAVAAPDLFRVGHYSTALLEKAARLNSVRFPRSLVYTRTEFNQHHPEFAQLTASPAAAIRGHPRLLV